MRLSIRQHVLLLVVIAGLLPLLIISVYLAVKAGVFLKAIQQATAGGELERIRRNVLLLTGFLAVGGVGAALWVSARLRRPIQFLQKGTRLLEESLETGGEPVELGSVGPSDWDPLVATFNQLARSLNEARQRDRQSQHEKQRIKDVLDRYVTAEVAKQILAHPDQLRLGGETKEVTVVLSDLRGFTMLVDNYPPEDVVELLNRYFSHMTDIIFAHQGTLDKFMGDSIMALFGAPVSRLDDTLRAVLCAVRMQLAMDNFNKENEGRKLPPLHMGIGINTGNVVAGNFGSERRSQYTVIGDQVNLVSRIEAFSLRGQILLSENTVERLEGLLDVNGPMLVHVKGKTDPVPLYELDKVLGQYQLQVPVREFRRYKRLAVELPFEFHIVHGKKTDANACPGKILNVSEGGLLAESDEQLAPMMNVKFSIPFEFRRRGTGDIYAKVLRVNPDGDIFRFNVEFTSILPEDRMLIRNIVADLA